MSSFT